MKKQWLFLIILAVLVVGFTDSLMGIPAFARKYKMSCNVCHAPFPRLKPYGDEFAGNGFVLKDKEAPRYVRDTGDDTLSLIRDLPIAVKFEGHLYYNNAKSESIDFSSPYMVKLLSGGTLAKNISYYFYFFFNERGSVAGLEDAFVMFNDVFKSGVSVAVGQFQVSDPLFKRELRLTFEDYLAYKAKPGLSSMDLTYDRGLMFMFGFKSGTDFTFEVLNGNGIHEADDDKRFDDDKYKNVFGRVSQSVGEHFRIGACAYYGKEEEEGMVNRAWIWGGDASITFETVELNFQYIERNDDNPVFLANPGDEIVTRGGFAELIFMPQGDNSKVYAVGLVNWIDSDDISLEYESYTVSLGVLLRRNFRLVGEVSYMAKGPYGKHTRAGVGLITAF